VLLRGKNVGNLGPVGGGRQLEEIPELKQFGNPSPFACNDLSPKVVEFCL